MISCVQFFIIIAGVSGFGTSGSLFGSKTFGNPAFSFNQSATNTTAPLFKPFSTTSSAPAPLFGMVLHSSCLALYGLWFI